MIALPASMKPKRVIKDGEEVLAHCEKHSNDCRAGRSV